MNKVFVLRLFRLILNPCLGLIRYGINKFMEWHRFLYLDYEKYRHNGETHESALQIMDISKRQFIGMMNRDKHLKRIFDYWDCGEDLGEETAEDRKENMVKLAYSALTKMIRKAERNPDAFKPNEFINLVREILDRTEGKAAQHIAIESKQNVTHNYVMSIDPAEAYHMLMENVIDVTPGGDTAKGGVGGIGCETPTQNTH